jgi:hypothetical protein
MKSNCCRVQQMKLRQLLQTCALCYAEAICQDCNLALPTTGQCHGSHS